MHHVPSFAGPGHGNSGPGSCWEGEGDTRQVLRTEVLTLLTSGGQIHLLSSLLVSQGCNRPSPLLAPGGFLWSTAPAVWVPTTPPLVRCLVSRRTLTLLQPSSEKAVHRLVRNITVRHGNTTHFIKHNRKNATAYRNKMVQYHFGSAESSQLPFEGAPMGRAGGPRAVIALFDR